MANGKCIHVLATIVCIILLYSKADCSLLDIVVFRSSQQSWLQHECLLTVIRQWLMFTRCTYVGLMSAVSSKQRQAQLTLTDSHSSFQNVKKAEREL